MGANYNVGRVDGGEKGDVKPQEVSFGLEVCDGHVDRVLEEIVFAELEGGTQRTPYFVQMSPAES